MSEQSIQIATTGWASRTGIPIETVRVRNSKIPASIHDIRLAAIADMHGGVRLGGQPAICALVADIMDMQPDAICLLGDMVHRAHNARRILAPLQDLAAPLGAYAVLGNHEHGRLWYSALFGITPALSSNEWRTLYGDLGIQLLSNEAISLHSDAGPVRLIGVDDAYSGHDDLAIALEDTNEEEFRLAITHFPDLIDDPAAAEVDFICAGHTHGSQVDIPGIGPLYTSCRRPRAWARGLVRENGTMMYVTRGVGEGVPVRLRCPREITLLKLEHLPVSE